MYLRHVTTLQDYDAKSGEEFIIIQCNYPEINEISFYAFLTNDGIENRPPDPFEVATFRIKVK